MHLGKAAQIGAPGVVLEPGQEPPVTAEVSRDERGADETRPRFALSADIEEPDTVNRNVARPRSVMVWRRPAIDV